MHSLYVSVSGFTQLSKLILEGFQMRTTLNIDSEILKKASLLTGVKEKTQLVRLGLEALILKENSKRLAALGGSEIDISVPARRQ